MNSFTFQQDNVVYGIFAKYKRQAGAYCREILKCKTSKFLGKNIKPELNHIGVNVPKGWLTGKQTVLKFLKQELRNGVISQKVYDRDLHYIKTGVWVQL